MRHPAIDEVLAATDGTKGSEDVRRHLATCESCRSLARLAEPPARDRSACALFDPLISRLAESGLSAADTRALELHLETCADCREIARIARPTHDETELPELLIVDPALYVKEGEIGSGGMGRTIRARDLRLGRTVALKELRDPRMSKRFEREARLTAKLQHPAIVGVHEAGRWPDGSPFYAMELVEGTPLDVRIAQCRTLADRLALLPALITVAEAVAYAHEKRIVHRDVKPQNIVLGEYGESVLIDWGLATDLGHAESGDVDPLPSGSPGDGLTILGAGTPQYMPPEQALGNPPDERMDVYALGATLYHLLAGTPPYGSGDSGPTRERLLAEPPAPLLIAAPEVPAALASLVAKAMARDPSARFRSAKELAEDLRRFQTGRMVSAHAYSPAEIVRHWIRRNRAPVLVACVALVVLFGGAAASFRRVAGERDRATAQSNAMLEEQGRRELLAGRPDRAAVFLSEAYRAGVDTPSLRFLLARAMQHVDARIADLEGTAEIRGAAFDAEGKRLAVVYADATARIWDTSSGSLIHSFSDVHDLAGRGTTVAWTPDGKGLFTFHDIPKEHEGKTVHEGAIMRRSLDGSVHGSVPAHKGGFAFSSAEHGRILTGGWDWRVKLWDARTLELLVEIDSGRELFGASLSPRGDRIAVASRGGPTTLWDATSGRLLWSLGKPTESSLGLEFSLDGRRLATGSPAEGARVWNVQTGALELDLAGKEDAVFTLDFTRDGTRLLTAGTNPPKLWDVGTERLVATFLGHDGFSGARFTSDERRIVTSGGFAQMTRVLESETGAELSAFHGVVPLETFGGREIGHDPSGRVLATTTTELLSDIRGKTVTLVRLGREPVVFLDSAAPASEPASVSARLSRDGSTLSATYRLPDERLCGARLWEIESGRVLRNEDAASLLAGCPKIADDGKSAVVRMASGRWSIQDAGSKVLAELDIEAPGTIEFSPDGTRVFIATAGESFLRDARDGAVVAVLSSAGDVWLAAFNRDGSRLATLSRDELVLWDRDGKRLAVCRPPEGRPADVRFSPDGTRLVLQNEPVEKPAGEAALMIEPIYGASLWDSRDGRFIAELEKNIYGVDVGIFDAKGARLVIGSSVFDPENGRRIASLADMPALALTKAVSPDGSLTAVGAFQGARLRDERGALRPRQLEASGASITLWATFSPDGAMLVTTNQYGGAFAWDVASGRLLSRTADYDVRGKAEALGRTFSIRFHGTYAEFTPDARHAVLTGPGAQVRLWHLGLESRAPTEVSALVAQRVPYRLDDGYLVATDPREVRDAPSRD